MVVLHHAVLAYYPNGPLPAHSLVTSPRWWQGFPVVDPAKWNGFTPFIVFNDSYTMALLFLVSGLFSWASLKRKGPGAYIQDRLQRLGIPLAFMCLIAPPTYFASYLQGGASDGFWHEWFSLHSWPAGPAWFLLALLIFDGIAIAFYALFPGLLEAAGRRIVRVQNPLVMVLALTLISAIFYVPAVLRFGPYGATRLFLPLSRLCHDFSYFLVGLALGSAGLDSGIIVVRGRLASRWAYLVMAAGAAFGLWQFVNYLSHRHYNPLLWGVLVGVAFCLSCSFSVFAALSIFLHFVKQPRHIWDNLLACSFGIYIIHYLLIAWIQVGLLHIMAPGWLKGPIVFFIAFPICWYVVSIARRSKWIARFV